MDTILNLRGKNTATVKVGSGWTPGRSCHRGDRFVGCHGGGRICDDLQVDVFFLRSFNKVVSCSGCSVSFHGLEDVGRPSAGRMSDAILCERSDTTAMEVAEFART